MCPSVREECGEKRILGGFCCGQRPGVLKNIASFGGSEPYGEELLRQVAKATGRLQTVGGERVTKRSWGEWMNYWIMEDGECKVRGKEDEVFGVSL